MGMRPQSFLVLPNMGIVSRPITPTPRKRNPKRLHSFRYYLQRRGKSGRSLTISYRQTTNEKESAPTGLATE